MDHDWINLVLCSPRARLNHVIIKLNGQNGFTENSILSDKSPTFHEDRSLYSTLSSSACFCSKNGRPPGSLSSNIKLVGVCGG